MTRALPLLMYTLVRWIAVTFAFTAGLSIGTSNGQLHPGTPAKYRALPGLREQAAILDSWRNQRVSQIPALLEKYGVDAWLVSP